VQHEWGYWNHVGLITEKFVGATVNEHLIILQCDFLKVNVMFPPGWHGGRLELELRPGESRAP
jgi:hypothetical protein